MVYACILVHGIPVYVQFDNAAAYTDFVASVRIGVRNLRTVADQRSGTFELRPYSVDAIFPDQRFNFDGA